MSFSRRQSILCCVTAAGVVARIATAEAPLPEYCDQRVLLEVRRQQLDQTERYAFRGQGPSSRCEGTLGRKHSLGEVTFAGAWRSCDAPRPNVEKGWVAINLPFRPQAQTLRIRVQAMLGNRPYLLDSKLDAESRQFKWPDALLAQLDISPSNLAICVWSGDGADSVQIPVTWSEIDSSCASPFYYLRFDWVRGRRSAIVYVRTPTGQELEPITVVGDYLGPSAWVPVSVSHFALTGVYRVRVSFTRSSESQFLLYHSRNP